MKKHYWLIWVPAAACTVAGLWMLRADPEGYAGWVQLLILLGIASGWGGAWLNFQRHFANYREIKSIERRLYTDALDRHTVYCVSLPDTTIIEVNDKFCETFGYRRSEIIGQPTSVLYAPGEDKRLVRRITDSVTAGRSFSGEFVQVTRQGEERIMMCTVVPLIDKTGRHVKNLSLRTDVTEARRADAQKRITSVLEGLSDQVYVYRTDDLKMVYLNEAARDWCEAHRGWRGDECLARSLAEMDEDFDLSEFRQRTAALLSGEVDSICYEGTHDGDPVEISLQKTRGAFEADCFVAVVRDITARREVERAKREMVSVVSHELRTPLTSILGSLKLVNSGMLGQVDDKARGMVTIAERNCERMLLVVNDMLDLEKIQSGKMDFTLSEIELGEVLAQAIEDTGGYAAEYGVRLKLDLPDRRVLVKGHADRLGQVLTNLLSNAIKFSPKDEIVELALREGEAGWRVSVTDRGPGIAPEDRDKIFDRFGQATPVDGVQRKGSGLGLHIVQNIIQAHDGRVALDSEVGRGSTFYFDLPEVPARFRPEAVAAQ